MMPDNWDVEWGGWALGDLADVLRRAADLLGRSQDVSQVVLTPPEEADALPRIKVVVPDESGLLRTRRQILRGEYLVDFIGESYNSRWSAEAAGFVLTVEKEEAT